MELAVLAVAVVVGGAALVLWMDFTRSCDEPDDFQRLRDAMSKPLPEFEED